MKISGGIEEDGIVVGNAYDKYGSGNPVVKWIMNGFHQALTALVEESKPKAIHEVGCGEGYWVNKWRAEGYSVVGSDFSSEVIGLAKENARQAGLSEDAFFSKSIYDLAPEDGADLIVCCEVLEHLENPESALQVLSSIVQDKIILSVPREPLWCGLNMLRGKYWSDFGNTPGHIQHWTSRQFIELISQYFEILVVKKPLPWTMVLCQPRTRQPGDANAV